MIHYLTSWLYCAGIRARDEERGDVPGWVMVTVMTAILVVAILAAFEKPIVNAVTDALRNVTGAK